MEDENTYLHWSDDEFSTPEELEAANIVGTVSLFYSKSIMVMDWKFFDH